MMVDLEGSTELVNRGDPEDVRELVDEYHRLVTEVIERCGGFIANYMGDGVMAYFGYPHPVERPAVAAVRSAVEIVERWRAAKGDPRPRVRVGIDTGEVIVDTGARGAERSKQDLTGPAVNVAARVQGLAPADGVTITEHTRRLVGDVFRLRSRGGQPIRGVDRPIGLHDVIGGVTTPTRSASPFVGRDLELRWLVDRVARAAEGESPAVIVTGEPGIGKSRLLVELAEAAAPVPTLTVRGLPERANVPFAPFTDVLDHSTSTSGRRELLDGLAAAVRARLGTSPSLLLVEDVHWFDPSSLDLVAHALRTGALAGVCTVMTARQLPDELAELGDALQRVTLTALPAPLARQLAAALLDGDHPELDELVDRGDGVPLFLEQLARFADDGTTPASQRLPTSVHELLGVQLDRLGPQRWFAQVASVFGRTFPVAAAARLAERDDVEQALAALVAAGLVTADEPLAGGDGTASFRHALVRDVAYRSLLRRDRERLHGHVADELDAAGGHEPSVLAQHRAAAGQHAQAADLWLAAVQRALGALAFVEASHAARAALDALEQLPPGADRDQRELVALLIAAPTVMLSRASAPEVRAWFDRARQLTTAIGDDAGRIVAVCGLAAALSQSGRHRDADEVMNGLTDDADRAKSRLLALMVHGQHGINRFNLGDLAGSETALRHTLSLWDPDRHDSLAARIPVDPGVMATADLCALEHFTGRSGDAATRTELFTDHMATWSDGHGRALGLGLLARVHSDLDDHAAAEAFAREAIDLAARHGAALIHIQMRALLAAGAVRSGASDRIEPMLAAIDELIEDGMGHSWTSFATTAADALVAVGEPTTAAALVGRIEAHAASFGETYALPRALLVRARSALARGQLDVAVADARRAATVARTQGNTLHGAVAATLLDALTAGAGTPSTTPTPPSR
jgi:class 3 adenylate cyclase